MEHLNKPPILDISLYATFSTVNPLFSNQSFKRMNLGSEMITFLLMEKTLVYMLLISFEVTNKTFSSPNNLIVHHILFVPESIGRNDGFIFTDRLKTTIQMQRIIFWNMIRFVQFKSKKMEMRKCLFQKIKTIIIGSCHLEFLTILFIRNTHKYMVIMNDHVTSLCKSIFG